MIRQLKKIKGMYRRWLANQAMARLKAIPPIPIDPEDFTSSLTDPNAYYRRSFQDFHQFLPAFLREHRSYYRTDRRGFGEDAFHSMWWRLIKRFRPGYFLEIGVYRGQVLSLVSLIARSENLDCRVTGISPFSPVGDSVSTYRGDIDYLEDTLRHFDHFQLPEPTLLKAFSTDPEAISAIASTEWDMIYIDGNHDYEVVKKDWETCSRAVKPGGIIILDDSGLGSGYRPLPFSTGGHPGPSKLAAEIDRTSFQEILQVGHNRVFQKRS